MAFFLAIAENSENRKSPHDKLFQNALNFLVWRNSDKLSAWVLFETFYVFMPFNAGRIQMYPILFTFGLSRTQPRLEALNILWVWGSWFLMIFPSGQERPVIMTTSLLISALVLVSSVSGLMVMDETSCHEEHSVIRVTKWSGMMLVTHSSRSRDISAQL